MVSQTIGELLRAARDVLKMTRQEVCLQVGVSQEHLRKVEGDESRPSPDLLIKLLDVLDLNTEQQQQAWVLLARSYLPDEVQAFVDVVPYTRGES